MANRLIRNTAILAKIEVTYGTDPTPTGGSNALLVSNLTINPINAQNVDRDIIRAYLGGSEQLLGTRYQEMSFDVEMVGSGTVAVAPAWGPLLRACGMGETIAVALRPSSGPAPDRSRKALQLPRRRSKSPPRRGRQRS
jgi:cell wall assembly regulator SMI1